MKLLRNLLKNLPSGLRGKIVRQLISLPEVTTPDLQFKVADTQEELEAAFKLLHDSYVEQRFMKPTHSGLRVTKYHALPTTVVLIGKHKGKVISTLTIIRDSSLGLPLDAAFDLSKIRRNCVHLGEISSLAIHKDYRKDHGAYLWPLLKFFYLYSSQFMGLDGIVLGAHPYFTDLYQSILCFEVLNEVKVEDQLNHYSFANGNPVVGFFETFESLKMKYEKIYSRRKSRKNLLSYFCTTTNGEIYAWPSRDRKRNVDYKLSPDLLSYFFVDKSEAFANLSHGDAQVILANYSQEPYSKATEPLKNKLKSFRPSANARYPLNTKISVEDSSKIQSLQCINVSRTGLKLKGAYPSRQFSIMVEIAAKQSLKLEIRWIRSCLKQENCNGFEIVNPSKEWENYVASMQLTEQMAA